MQITKLEIKFVSIISILLLISYFIFEANKFLICFFIVFAVWGLVKFFIARPLLEIIKKIENFKNGIITSEVSFHSRDEIGTLANNFNSMLRNVSETQNGLNKRIQELSAVNQICQAMNTKFIMDEVLELIVTSCKETIKAETVSLMLIDPKTNELIIKIAAGINVILMKRRMKIGEGISGWVALHGQPLLIQDIEKDGRFKRKSSKKYATKSLLSVPLVTKGKVIGVLNVNNKNSNELFTESDLNLLTILASQAATTIEHTRLTQESLDKKNIDQQMEIAREIQIQLLPKKLPNIIGLDIEVLSAPASDLGGDYCDVIDIKEKDAIVVTIGDVSGKGIPANLLMIMLRSFLKIEAMNETSPKKVLKQLNELIIADNKLYSDIFISLFYGVINKKTFSLTYSSAGHDPLYLFHRKTGTFETLKTGDLILGIFPDIEYNENIIQLQESDLLILYTDGIIEAKNSKNILFGEERFIRTVFRNIKKPANLIKDAIYNEVLRFSGEEKQNDDITLLTIDVKYNPEIETSCTSVCRDALHGTMVITYMDKWFDEVIKKATMKILQLMKEKNMITSTINFDEVDIENIFFKRSIEDIPQEQNKDKKVLKINLRAVFDYVFAIDVITEELGKLIGFDDDTVYEWTVAVKEAVINAISYGSDFDKEEWIGVYYYKEKDKIIVSVRDHGKGFDVNKIKDPRDNSVIFSDHGRGILLIKGFMDEVKFNVIPNKGTEVIMIKNLPENIDI